MNKSKANKSVIREVVSFSDASGPNISYTVTDEDNKEVIVNTKAQGHHSSDFKEQDTPHVFQNIGCVIQNPSRKYKSTSKTKQALEKNKKGITVVYELDDFYGYIDNPVKYTKSNYKMIVPVHYGDDGRNYTLTYYDAPNIGI